MKKGFTLIELLAVIVILAIIALIATPIVLNIISDSKKSAELRSAEMYLSAVEQSISIKKMDNPNFKPSTCTVLEKGDLDCEGTNVKVDVKGTVPNEGSIITFDEGKIKEVNLEYTSDRLIIKEEGNLIYKEYIYLDNFQHKHMDGAVEKHDVTFDNNGHGICSKCKKEVLAPGLYAEDGTMTKSWQQLIDEEIIYITDGELKTYPPGLISYPNPNSDNLNGKLIISDDITSIGEDAFVYCENLTSVVIPNSITTINDDAFFYCLSLKSITIPSSVTKIENSAFATCINLESIIVDKDNPVYDSRDNSNAIIETATNTIIAGCKNTIFPASVTTIGSYAFYGFSNLTTVTIPTTITSIKNYAFSYCTSLTNINYSGTTEQWNQISKDSSWNKDSVALTVNCTNGTISVPKNETQFGPLF